MNLLLVGNWFVRSAPATVCWVEQGGVSVLSDEGSSGTRVLGVYFRFIALRVS
jgi:hypothetical protein